MRIFSPTLLSVPATALMTLAVTPAKAQDNCQLELAYGPCLYSADGSCTPEFVDATPPEIQPAVAIDPLCGDDPQLVEVAAPPINDACSEAELVGAALIDISGQQVAIDIFPSLSFVAVPGEYTIRWHAEDAAGNASSFDQLFQVTGDDPSIEQCCDDPQLPGIPGAILDDNPNIVTNELSPTSVAIDALGGDDLLAIGSGNDCLIGGDGSDNMSSVAGHDQFFGGDGHDVIEACRWARGGSAEISAGPGHDNVAVRYCEGSTVFGGAGHDVVAGSMLWPDSIYPGSGNDQIHSYGGDDLVQIFHVCELDGYTKLLDGGAGEDTLILPVDPSDAALSGVTIVGFENIIVSAATPHLSDCF